MTIYTYVYTSHVCVNSLMMAQKVSKHVGGLVVCKGRKGKAVPLQARMGPRVPGSLGSQIS